MIAMSDVIAVIDVIDVEQAPTKGSHWTYGEKITAKPITILKGELSDPATIYGLENFICARCIFKKGKQLVFLTRDKDLLSGSNWHLSIRPIEGNQLDWFSDKTSIKLIPTTLDNALDQIRAEIKRNKAEQGA